MATQGPWRVGYPDGSGVTDSHGPYTITSIPTGEVVVQSAEGENSDMRSWSHGIDDIDDAHRIAAAPEMYEALKYVFDHIADKERRPRDLYPAFGLNSSRAVEMVRAAIAKAEGRDQ